ncbi:hypothetical protein DY000_02042983 [Brassica cretica]|uniref:Legume lectin domain-containing protein n=1 Tax=Brassica cretica TaxID=69181 RepID=A0ABQ7B3K7_BRACR|nr:hypothetical protein DY000_02042983 [Brassica cretica]
MTSNVAANAGYWVQTSVGKRKVWSFKDVNLSSGEKFTAWVEFRKRDNRITVTLAPENMKKPKRPLIQGPRELNDVLLQNGYVGFAGAMGRVVLSVTTFGAGPSKTTPRTTKPVWFLVRFWLNFGCFISAYWSE